MKFSRILVCALSGLLACCFSLVTATAETTVQLHPAGTYAFEGPVENPTAFRIGTAGGELAIQVLKLKDGHTPRYMATYSLTTSPETATYLETANNGVTKQFTITYHAYGFQKFSADLKSGELDLLESRIPDCAELQRSEIFQALSDAALSVGSDFKYKYGQAIEVSGDQAALTGALLSLTTTLSFNPGCEAQAVNSSQCARDQNGGTNQYSACQVCCSSEGPGPLSFACAALVRAICTSHWCAGAGGLIGCGQIVDLEQDECEHNNCEGLPGDPSCASPPPCTGFCYVDPGCGILRCGECGYCESESMRCCGSCSG